jgi:hypothetical protein
MPPKVDRDEISLSTFVQVYTIRLEHIQTELDLHRVEFQDYRKCANKDRADMIKNHQNEIEKLRQESKSDMKEKTAENRELAILLAKVQNQLNLITILVLAATTAVIGLVVKIFAAGGTVP